MKPSDIICKGNFDDLKIAIGFVLFGWIQVFIGWMMISGFGNIEAGMLLHPLVTLIVLNLPGWLLIKLSMKIMMPTRTQKERHDAHMEFLDNTPFIFWVPLFQMHSGILYLARFAFVISIRAIIYAKESAKKEQHVDSYHQFRSDGFYIISHSIHE